MATFNTTVGLAPSAGYHCFCDCATPVGATFEVIDPVHGPVTLTWDEAEATWIGILMSAPVAGRPSTESGCGDPASVTVPIKYWLSCEGGFGGPPALNIGWRTCDDGAPMGETTLPDPSGWSVIEGVSLSSDESACDPATLETVAWTPVNTSELILWPGGPHVFTAAESA